MNAPIVTTLLRALLRWWWLIALSISLGFGAGYLLRSEQQDLFYSQATVTIGRDSSSTAAGDPIDPQALDAYTVLISRNTMLQPVIDDLELNMSVGELLNRMSIETEQSAALLSIGIVDTDPDRAAVIANRIVDELIRQTSDRATLLDLEFINGQISDIQRQITDLQVQYDALVDEASSLTSAFALNTNLEERREIERTIQELRTLLLDLVNNAPRSEVQIFEPAVPNYYPIVANGWIDLVLAGGAGGVLSVLTVLAFTFFDDRLQWDEGKHETVMGLRVLGPLGIVAKNKLPLYVDTMPQSVETEAMRQLRAKIALACGGKHPRVVTFMSYDSGEGKTLTSANFALETARAGLRTLAIDGDMRRGDLHEVFSLPNVFGLSDVLHSREPLADLLSNTILDSGYENLAILPAGRSMADPAALLSQPRFKQLIEFLAGYYDALVIDAAPTIAGPDAVFLSEASTGVVIIVNARRTRLSSLKQSVEELSTGQNIHILGVVFNRVRLQVTSKYNNTYYHQAPTLNAEKLRKELAKPGSGLLAARRHVIIDKNGERLYSVEACAARMGVKRRTVRGWITSGYVQSERRFMRPWIRESVIDALLDKRVTAAPPPEPVTNPAPSRASAVNGTHEVPTQLREQREAILGFVNQPKRSDPEV